MVAGSYTTITHGHRAPRPPYPPPPSAESVFGDRDMPAAPRLAECGWDLGAGRLPRGNLASACGRRSCGAGQRPEGPGNGRQRSVSAAAAQPRRRAPQQPRVRRACRGARVSREGAGGGGGGAEARRGAQSRVAGRARQAAEAGVLCCGRLVMEARGAAAQAQQVLQQGKFDSVLIANFVVDAAENLVDRCPPSGASSGALLPVRGAVFRCPSGALLPVWSAVFRFATPPCARSGMARF